MRLQLIQTEMDADPETADREMARGIHPSILTEHGLTAAPEVLARRSPIPVTVACRRARDRFPVIGCHIPGEARGWRLTTVDNRTATTNPLARAGPGVVPKDIAGARFVSREDARILERVLA